MPYTIRRVSSEEDRITLLNFWEQNRGQSLKEKYQWFYEDNPAGKADAFLLIEGNEGRCVGCIAVFSRLISIGCKIYRAGIAGDFFVQSKHRTLLPALLLCKKLVSLIEGEEYDLIYGFPNDKAVAVFDRAGFIRLGSFIRMSKLIKTSELLQSMNWSKYTCRCVAPFFDLALKFSAIETWYPIHKKWVLEDTLVFDERFDKLWDNIRTKGKGWAIGERSSRYLTWKYINHPNIPYSILTMFSEDKSDIKGYLVYCKNEVSIEIHDFVLPDNNNDLTIFMLTFLKRIRTISQRSVTVNLLNESDLIAQFSRYGFKKRGMATNCCYYANAKTISQQPEITIPGRWVLLKGDSDVIE